MIEPAPAGRLLGFTVRVDWSWALICGLMALAVAVRLGLDAGSLWGLAAWSVAATALLAVSVLVHELSHAVAARRQGIDVRAITLFGFGGYTEMGAEPAGPRGEFLVAAAGPVASAALGGLFLAFRAATGSQGDAGEVLGLLGAINVAVALFNLLPGFPLDGGRVLRSAVWRVSGDADRATRVAADAGRILGVGAVGAGVAIALDGALVIAAAWVVVGWFLYRIAAAARRTVGRLSTPVGLVMAPAAASVTASEAAPAGGSEQIPVVDGGRVIGLVGPARPGRPSAEVMTSLRPADVIGADTPIGMVLRRLRWRRRTIVVVADGVMVGTLSPERAAAWLGRSAASGAPDDRAPG